LSDQGGNWVAIRLLFRLEKFQNPGKTGMWKGICAGVLASLQNRSQELKRLLAIKFE